MLELVRNTMFSMLRMSNHESGFLWPIAISNTLTLPMLTRCPTQGESSLVTKETQIDSAGPKQDVSL
jgi:hypothetical protein